MGSNPIIRSNLQSEAKRPGNTKKRMILDALLRGGIHVQPLAPLYVLLPTDPPYTGLTFYALKCCLEENTVQGIISEKTLNNMLRENSLDKNNVVILLSGGMDSAACIVYYKELGFSVRGLFIDYGQLSRKYEKQSAASVSNYYGIPLEQATFSTRNNFGLGEICGRNAFFLMAALLVYPEYKGLFSLGIHTGTLYYDCSENFIENITVVLNAYTNGKIRFDAPFISWNKAMIFDYCKENNVPINLTYSCQAGTNPPCGKCDSCKDREVLGVG